MISTQKSKSPAEAKICSLLAESGGRIPWETLWEHPVWQEPVFKGWTLADLNDALMDLANEGEIDVSLDAVTRTQ